MLRALYDTIDTIPESPPAARSSLESRSKWTIVDTNLGSAR